jgi:hypothetical protein
MVDPDHDEGMNADVDQNEIRTATWSGMHGVCRAGSDVSDA